MILRTGRNQQEGCRGLEHRELSVALVKVTEERLCILVWSVALYTQVLPLGGCPCKSENTFEPLSTSRGGVFRLIYFLLRQGGRLGGACRVPSTKHRPRCYNR